MKQYITKINFRATGSLISTPTRSGKTRYLKRVYLFVINCLLIKQKKRKTVPKLPFLTRKPPFLGLFFQKKNKKLSHTPTQIYCVSGLFYELRSRLCEVIEPSMQFSIQFSFNFKRSAPLKPIVLYHPRKTKKRKTVPKLPFLTRKPPFIGPFF